jgi:LysM repeat protein
MRRQVQDQMVTWVSRSVAMAAATATLFATGCVRRQSPPALLGARTLVPAPFVEPATSAPAASLPPEPAVPGTTVVPGGKAPEEDLVLQPAEELSDVKPAKSTWGKSAATKGEGERLTYTVKKGDSLWLIGQMYGVSVAELTAENNLQGNKFLKVGQVLELPAGARLRDVSEIKRAPVRHTAAASSKPKAGAAAKSTSPAKAAATAGTSRRTLAKEPIPADGMYTIKSGDNPWDLARKFGVKHDDLMKWNNLKNDTVLQVGQKIRLRAAGESAAPAVTPAGTAPAAAPAAGTVLPEATTPAPAGTPAPTPGTETTPAAPGAAPAAAAPAATTPPAGAPAAVGAGAAAAATPGALDLPKKLSHSVTEGETLQIIAEMYGTTVDAIKKENPTIKSDADLQPNMKLMVPYR